MRCFVHTGKYVILLLLNLCHVGISSDFSPVGKKHVAECRNALVQRVKNTVNNSSQRWSTSTERSNKDGRFFDSHVFCAFTYLSCPNSKLTAIAVRRKNSPCSQISIHHHTGYHFIYEGKVKSRWQMFQLIWCKHPVESPVGNQHCGGVTCARKPRDDRPQAVTIRSYKALW